jgi:hypothetical protein
MEDNEAKGCLALGLAVIERCFYTPKYSNGDSEQRKATILRNWKIENVEFANSRLFNIICDCSYNLEASKIRKKIIIRLKGLVRYIHRHIYTYIHTYTCITCVYV